MNRHTVAVAVVFLVLTTLGELLALKGSYFPLAAADEAGMVDRAFRALVAFSVPVLSFVVAVLGYSVLRFRSQGQPAEDGPAVHIHKPWVAFWLVWTAGLTILVIIYPGVIGLNEIRHHGAHHTDLTVDVEAGRWYWKVTYPKQGVITAKELVLPVGKSVHFDVKALDVIHSFWIPAFRMKIDAVPGMTTSVAATPTEIGSFDGNSQFRLQCAELCGLAHALMTVPVRVVSQADFEAWVAAQSRQARNLQQ